MNKYDRRQSGRTTKMLMAALRLAKDGVEVIVVLENQDKVRNHVAFLTSQDYGGIYTNHKGYTTGGRKGLIQFRSMSNPDVNLKTLQIKGIRPENIFWDHEVVRLTHNRIIQEFHRYD